MSQPDEKPLHRWSGWPGSWCLDCGIEDVLEAALVCDQCQVPTYPGEYGNVTTLCSQHRAQPVCPEPGSNRHNPYMSLPDDKPAVPQGAPSEAERLAEIEAAIRRWRPTLSPGPPDARLQTDVAADVADIMDMVRSLRRPALSPETLAEHLPVFDSKRSLFLCACGEEFETDAVWAAHVADSLRRPAPGEWERAFAMLWRGLPFALRHSFGGDAGEARDGLLKIEQSLDAEPSEYDKYQWAVKLLMPTRPALSAETLARAIDDYVFGRLRAVAIQPITAHYEANGPEIPGHQFRHDLAAHIASVLGPPPGPRLTKVDQRKNGCWAACIASLTGLSLDDLPHPTDEELTKEAWSEYHNRLTMALHQAGWTLLGLGARRPTGYAIATGAGPRGLDHSVVVLNGQLWHDPHTSRAGLLDTSQGYEIVVPVSWAWTERDEQGNAVGWREVGDARLAERGEDGR